MKRRALVVAMVAAALTLYAAVSLWPYEWQVREQVVNGVEPLPDGGVRFRKPGIALTEAAPAWLATAMRSHELAISLEVRSLAPQQFGPARILTLSLDPYRRNLTIGQDEADLVLRLRTAWTDANGQIDGTPVARVPGVFLTNDWIDLGVLIKPGLLNVTVADELLVEQGLPPRPLESWDPSYRLALGNELTGDRPWLGEIRRAVVGGGRLIEHYAGASELDFPPHFLITWQSPKLIPFHTLNIDDAVKNILLYLPLGFLLGILLNCGSRERSWRNFVAACVFIAAVSASLEGLQYFLPRRWPSIDDVIFNTLGGGCGLLLALWAPRLRALASAVRP